MNTPLNRSGFFWGVCGHPRSWKAYPEGQLDNQLKLVQELGVDYYRMDMPAGNEDDLIYCDKVVSTAKKYNVKIFAIYYGANIIEKAGSEGIQANAEYFARRYKDDIFMYQIDNEIDCPTINKNNPLGMEISDYDLDKLDTYYEKLKHIIIGIRRGNPEAKISINGTWWHTGFIEYFLSKGLDFDIIGWDWYSSMCDKSSINDILDKLCTFGKDIIIAESNISTVTHTEAARGAYIAGLMRKVYEYPSDKIKGMIIYELLDETNPANPQEHEKYFGIVRCDENGNIGEPKPAFYDIQKRLKNIHKLDLTSSTD